MNWTGYSSDTNCIDNVWSFLKRENSNRVLPPMTIQPLKTAVIEECENFPQNMLNYLVFGMPRRIHACVMNIGPVYFKKYFVSLHMNRMFRAQVTRLHTFVNGGKCAGKRVIPEKTLQPAASYCTISTCKNPGDARPVIEPDTHLWEASRLTAQPPWPHDSRYSCVVEHVTELGEFDCEIRKRCGGITSQITSVDLCGRHTLQAGVEPVDKELAQGTELSGFDKGMIVGCHFSGLSSRTIAWKWKVDGHCANAARSGRPPTLTDRNGRALKREIVKNRAQPMASIRQKFHDATGVSTLEQWKSVLWSDESRFTLFRSDGRVLVWRLPGERFLSECIVPTRKFGGGGEMVWGCFTAFGVGPMLFVRCSMNKEAYCNILGNEMLPTLWRFYGMDPCYFQDGNARCHVSRPTMQWYADNNVRRLDWLAQSPDLNPIERLWDGLDRRVRACQTRPKSIAQLMEWFHEEWRRIPVDVLQTLVESVPDRVAAFIAARVNMERRRNEGAGKREIPEQTHRSTALYGTIPTYENLETRLGIEAGSPWWEESVLIAQPPWPHVL
ncbi:hypothetical protein PR048_011850 [Dryococelus australis]|uniref:Transposase n=1 Tax=Dryococelus australis TaxID=614101 RepID=A0ABQ9HN24_9NEOP|nr:hypothetical protein PR048_011850 [Dryococelus australis]